jgi:hypothetical protein
LDALQFFEKAINTIETHYHGKIRYIRLDRETSLGNAFEALVIEKSIKPERTAPDTLAQNGGSERSGRVIITKARTMRIEANLPANMWPEVVKAAGYTANRTPVRRLSWKTPFEVVLKHKPRLVHMHVYGCRAYLLDYYIPKKNKLEPRAHIGYLVGYDSTNIYRIWIPSRKKVIQTQDVTMDDNCLYSPTDLDIRELLETTDQVIEALEIPEILVLATLDSDSLLDTFAIEDSTQIGSEKSTGSQSTGQSPTRQSIGPLPTPSPTPSERSSSNRTSETL